MKLAIELIRYVHIAAGFSALILFWVPAFTRKGGHLHQLTGSWYVKLMWIVLGTAGMLSIKNAIIGEIDMALFLGFLVILTSNPLWYGQAILKHKKELPISYVLKYRWINIFLIIYGLILVAYGLTVTQGLRYLMFFFGIAGVLSIGAVIKSYRMVGQKPNWYKVHFEGMIWSGVAAHTAFFAIGGRAYLSQMLDGYLQLITWILPTVLGIFIIRYMRHMNRSKGFIPNE